MSGPVLRHDDASDDPAPAIAPSSASGQPSRSSNSDFKVVLALGLAGLVILAGILTDHIPGSSRSTLPKLGTVKSKPSFDCADAYEWVERAICSDVALAALDNQNAALYQQRASGMTAQERKDLAKAEEEWVGQRNGCESKPDPFGCIAQAYRQRISELSGNR